MRVFLIADGNGAEMAELVLALEKEGHEVVYWVGLATGAERNFPKIIFHSHFDARAGIPAPVVDIGKFSPPGEDLLRQLAETESLVLSMMKRRLVRMSSSESRHLYYSMVRYWTGVIKAFRPDVILFPLVPHHMYNYLIYSLAKLYDIKTVMFEDTWISDRALLYHDFWQGSMALQTELRANKGQTFASKDLATDLREYYLLQTDSSRDATPAYLKRQLRKYQGQELVTHKLSTLRLVLKQGRLLRSLLGKLFRVFGQNLKKAYLALETAPDFTKKFVYVPLNYQPERTTSPQGGVFVDQVLMIETLAAALPQDWVIYVKEHPTQWIRSGLEYNNVRYPGYYQQIAKLPAVFLVPLQTDTYALIRNSQAVATVTGTAGWEALFRGKPALVFGYPWYRDCPAILRVRDLDSCRAALRKIQEGFQIVRQDLLNYLKSLDGATIHCYVDDFGETNSPFMPQERLSNFIKAILSELREFKQGKSNYVSG